MVWHRRRTGGSWSGKNATTFGAASEPGGTQGGSSETADADYLVLAPIAALLRLETMTPLDDRAVSSITTNIKSLRGGGAIREGIIREEVREEAPGTQLGTAQSDRAPRIKPSGSSHTARESGAGWLARSPDCRAEDAEQIPEAADFTTSSSRYSGMRAGEMCPDPSLYQGGRLSRHLM